jgi:acetyl-CoA carboxylase biotin carboxyl carrier protein
MATKKSDVDQQLIRDLAGILHDTNLTEIEVELGDLKIRVSRGGAAVQAFAAPMPVAVAPQAAPAAAVAAPAADLAKNAVASPMVGTAYLPLARLKTLHRSRPDHQGRPDTSHHRGHEDDEPDPSPRSGTIKAILFEDAQPVEYGEPLVVIE